MAPPPRPRPAGTQRVGFSSAAPHLKELKFFLFSCLSVVSDARPTIEQDSFSLLCPRQADGWKTETLLTDRRAITHGSAELFYVFQLTVSFFCPPNALFGVLLCSRASNEGHGTCCMLQPSSSPQSSCCDPVTPQASAVEVKTLQVICQRLKQLMDDADGESAGRRAEREK